MAATLVLRTVKGTPLTNYEVDNNFSNLNTFGDVVSSNIGVLTNLTTTAKGNIVVAVNELAANTGVTAATYGGSTSIPVITISSNGRITSASNVTAGLTITNDTSTDNTYYIPFTTSTSGSLNTANVSSSKLFFNPSSGLLTSTDYNSSSDMTLKQDFVPIQNPLDIIGQLTGFGFTWKESKQKAYGLSAQEVEKVIPEIVKERPDGTKGINYMNLVAFLVEAIKDLKQEVTELKKHK
jgi:hypothetical protein